MINLRKEVCYEFIDDQVIEIFDKYKWSLQYLGVRFSQEILETIVDCSFHLENSLIAFCAWILWKKEKGDIFNHETLNSILIDALQEAWNPTDFQKKYLKEHDYILKSPRELIWEEAGKILGYELRNRTLADITENYNLIFMDNLKLTSDDENKLKELQEYINELRKSLI
ncbi:MAG: hypothetical protein AB4058_16165 [Microcystaceae cyanobacterium]